MYMHNNMTFSQGSSIENTNVDSNHILCFQKNTPIFEDGRRVKLWLGFAGGKFAGAWAVAVGDIGKSGALRPEGKEVACLE